MAEELAFKQVFRDGAAVNFYQRSVAARAGIVNGLRDEFLSRACLTRNQDGRIGWSHDRDLFKQCAQGGTAPDNPLNAGFASTSSASDSSPKRPPPLRSRCRAASWQGCRYLRVRAGRIPNSNHERLPAWCSRDRGHRSHGSRSLKHAAEGLHSTLEQESGKIGETALVLRVYRKGS